MLCLYEQTFILCMLHFAKLNEQVFREFMIRTNKRMIKKDSHAHRAQRFIDSVVVAENVQMNDEL